ncbi:MAG: efflux RND transporter periplasmic adaptor subunit [Gemmatimonadaceae bacterium]
MSRISRVACIAGALALAAGCRKVDAAREAPKTGPDSVIVLAPAKASSLTVAAVGARSERLVANLAAQLVPNEDRTVRVSSPVTGRVRALDAFPGTFVRPGSPLAHIVSGDLAQAVSDLAKANAVMASVEANLTRTRDLYEHHVASRKDLEQAETDAAQARAEALRARARIEQLGSASGGMSGEYVLRSPIAGEVIERNANPGMEVRPDLGTTLFTVSDLSTLWLTANLFQKDLADVHPGARLVFRTDAVPGRTFEARVTYVSNALDPSSRTAVLRATLPNLDHALRTMETGDARLYVQDTQPSLVVPTRAIVTHGDASVVFVETAPNRFVRRVVKVGDDDGESTVILSGLKPGERVVVDGSILLEGEAQHAY